MLSVVTIFEKPRDFPDSFVARRFTVGDGGVFATGDYQIAPDISPLRQWAHDQLIRYNRSGAYNIGREPQDHKSVVENWV